MCGENRHSNICLVILSLKSSWSASEAQNSIQVYLSSYYANAGAPADTSTKHANSDYSVPTPLFRLILPPCWLIFVGGGIQIVGERAPNKWKSSILPKGYYFSLKLG